MLLPSCTGYLIYGTESDPTKYGSSIPQHIMDPDYMKEVAKRIETYRKDYGGPGLKLNHPAILVSPIPVEVFVRPRFTVAPLFPLGNINIAWFPEADRVRNIVAPDGTILPAGVEESLYEASCGGKGQFVFARDVLNGEYRLFHTVVVIRKFRLEEDVMDHYFLSNEEIDYKSHGFELQDQTWIDLKNPRAVEKLKGDPSNYLS